MSLPVTGQTNWGVPLNSYITNAVLAVANQALTSINAHTTATDPHGDRAYAASLVSPLTTGVNLPNGFVQLNSSGVIPSALLPAASSLSNYYDAKRDFGATGNGSTDDSASLQNALNACATAGGGEVWVGDGTYALGSQLVIGSGTWLHLSPGATIKRIIPVAGSAPSIMIANVSFASGTSVPAAGNILISGGKWDAVGSSLSSNCTPIFLVQASFASVAQTYINGIAGNPAIELNGGTNITVRDCVFTGSALTAGSGIVPAVRLNSTSASTTPSGMASSVYNNTACSNVVVATCSMTFTGTQPSTNRLLGADLYASRTHSVVMVTGCATAGGSFRTDPPVDFTHINEAAAYGNLWNTNPGTAALDLTATGNIFVGPSSASGTPPVINVAGQLVFATGFPGNNTAETWHNMTLKNGFSSNNDVNGVNYPPSYKMLPDGSVALRGILQTPFATSTGVVFATLPATYACTLNHPAGSTVSNSSGGQVGQVYLDSGGNLQLNGAFGENINIWLDGAILQRT